MKSNGVLARTLTWANAVAVRYLDWGRWYPDMLGYGGYGSTDAARIMGRVLMTRKDDQRAWLGGKAGWHQYVDVHVAGQPVLVRLGDSTAILESDEGGYIDVRIYGHGLKPGWHHAQMQVINRSDWKRSADKSLAGLRAAGVRLGKPRSFPVRIIGPDETVGVISDVDDTIMVTMMPRPLQAAKAAFLEKADSRQPVPGMAKLLSRLGQTNVGTEAPSPVIYLSTGAWNVAPTLRRFLHVHGYPRGGLLLRPWGLNASGLAPSGTKHKVTQFERLTDLLPHVRWYLLGDDGQHDPATFTTIARRYPDRVAGIFIRNLSGAEHVLQHGSASPRHALGDIPGHIPVFTGADGHELARAFTAQR